MSKLTPAEYEYYSEKFEEFQQFLFMFASEPGSTPGISDVEIVKKYVATWPTKQTLILQVLIEGREMLALHPFPFNWISHATNKALSNVQGDMEEEKYHKWTTWILDALEEEAKKAGKL